LQLSERCILEAGTPTKVIDHLYYRRLAASVARTCKITRAAPVPLLDGNRDGPIVDDLSGALGMFLWKP
jgi:hypothetical protein